MTINLYMTYPGTEALGPCKRYAVWVQGCNRRCKGCISPEAQSLGGGYTVNVSDLAADILAQSDIEGITISGGEPFLQADALCQLIQTIREDRELGVILYTGNQFEEISSTPLAGLCDLIIDGEYVEELNDDKSLRGSSNQRVICVTDRYMQCVEQLYGVSGRKVEFVFCGQKANMIGIPAKSLLSQI